MLLGCVLVTASACGAGQEAQTSNEAPAVQGADAQAGPMRLLDLMVPFRQDGYPAGSDVPLVVRIVSEATSTVQLSAVGPGPAGDNAVIPAEVTPDGVHRLPVAVAAQGCSLLVPPDGGYLIARKIKAEMTYGYSVSVRFTFTEGGSVDVAVPMAPPDAGVSGPQDPGLCRHPDW
ncbi:hypothetical protein GCM10010435_94700 [Winogradskya consettensis]|uniref:Uncharacterized protein n=2 Tax=Winogradskya consettensis TaxID=113560 RepID=A0A919SYR5_9ACTN|nr:hypothetical protein Aco04nite_67520 [Actinoplanes consettensis]